MIPCAPWITEQDLSDCGCPTATTEIIEAAILEAQTVLYASTGHQFPGDTCTKTVRPCSLRCNNRSELACSSPGVSRFALPNTPVGSITQILIDGAVFSAYRLDKPNVLTRTDGEAWPCCQDLGGNSQTDEGTWQVEYVYGVDPPAALKTAAATLATELVKACTSDKTCRIPAGAVTVSRRGISYNIDVGEGKTGIYEVDLIVSALNPAGRKRRARIVSPDDTRFITV